MSWHQLKMKLLIDEAPRVTHSCWVAFRGDGQSLFSRRAPESVFLKGCQWSPDGAILLTAADDGVIRLHDLPEEVVIGDAVSAERIGGAAAADKSIAASDSHEPISLPVSLSIDEGECIYDAAWHPRADAEDPTACCVASTSRGLPIHLWDALGGHLRASYVAHDDKDNPTSAISVAFSSDGSRVVGGYNNVLRCFDAARPGRDCYEWTLHRRRRRRTPPDDAGIPGIASAIAHSSASPDVLAVGSYRGVGGLVDARTGAVESVWEGHKGGITQVAFSPDGYYVYSGARADPHVVCWDARGGRAVYVLERQTAKTNQRIQLDIEPIGRHLLTGGEDGCLRGYDLAEGRMVAAHRVANDVVNGVSIHPWLPVVAVATGTRRFQLGEEGAGGSSDDEGPLRPHTAPETGMMGDTLAPAGGQDWSQNSVSLWMFGLTQVGC